MRRNIVSSFPCCRVTLFNPHYSKHLSFSLPALTPYSITPLRCVSITPLLHLFSTTAKEAEIHHVDGWFGFHQQVMESLLVALGLVCNNMNISPNGYSVLFDVAILQPIDWAPASRCEKTAHWSLIE